MTHIKYYYLTQHPRPTTSIMSPRPTDLMRMRYRQLLRFGWHDEPHPHASMISEFHLTFAWGYEPDYHRREEGEELWPLCWETNPRSLRAFLGKLG